MENSLLWLLLLQQKTTWAKRNGKKQSIQKEATVPKAKKTHQAQDRWLMGNLQHPKLSSLGSVAMRSSGCSTVLKGLSEAELHPKPGLCFIYLILPFKCLDFNPAITYSELMARSLLSFNGKAIQSETTILGSSWGHGILSNSFSEWEQRGTLPLSSSLSWSAQDNMMVSFLQRQENWPLKDTSWNHSWKYIRLAEKPE